MTKGEIRVACAMMCFILALIIFAAWCDGRRARTAHIANIECKDRGGVIYSSEHDARYICADRIVRKRNGEPA